LTRRFSIGLLVACETVGDDIFRRNHFSFDFASLESLVVSEDSLSLLLSFFAFFAGGMLPGEALYRQVATFSRSPSSACWSRRGCVALPTAARVTQE
jgi:hypothetical protein